MNLAVGALCALVLLAVLLDAMIAGWFCRKLKRRTVVSQSDGTPPWVTIVLSLRGSDPFLRDCLNALAQLKYNSYDIRIVVDHPNDSASGIVHAWQRNHPGLPIKIEYLTHRSATCSLKCSALVQVITSLGGESDVVALVDADVIPHPTWLSELVAPFGDPAVGAVSGCRWYVPPPQSFGAMLRCHWNSAATSTMVVNNMAWGGCLALRTTAIQSVGIVTRWNLALTEDIMVSEVIRSANWKLRVLPELMMVNRETCSVGQAYEFMRRQMICASLYSGVFRWRTRLVMLSFISVLLALFGLLLFSVLHADIATAAVIGSTLASYLFVMATLQVVVNRRISEMHGKRRVGPDEGGQASVWQHVLCLPASHMITLIAILATYCQRHVVWRGVSYRVTSAWSIHRLDDAPFIPVVASRLDSI